MRFAFIALLFFLFGCSSNKTIDGATYGTYGLVNESEMKNDNIQYQIVEGNIVWAVILCETIVAPIYFFGWDLYEPIGVKPEGAATGQIR